MNLKKLLPALLVLIMVGTGLRAQEEVVPIKSKSAVFIPKLDVFWSTVVIADNFPTFFPVELELNLPGPSLSVNVIASPWWQTSSTQIATTKSFTAIGGLGLRYYFRKKEAMAASATGFFVEPQFFFRYARARTQEIGGPLTITNNTETGFFLSGGYQHSFASEVLYLQGRLSVGVPTADFLSSWSVGDDVTVLPWIGVGIRVN